MQLQTSNQINKRPIVPGRKAFHSSALLPAAKGRVSDGSNKSAAEVKPTSPSQLCESMNLQPTPLTAASVHNGNGSSTETNKNLTTSSVPTSRKVIGSQCNTTAMSAKQTIPCSLSVAGTTLRASSRTVHKAPRKKSRVKQLPLGDYFSNANDRKGHKDFAHTVQHLGRTKKVIVKRCAPVVTVSQTRMLRWNKNKHELVRISTSNGHHRLLRSSGQRVLPTSLQSIRNKARKRNALKRRNNMPNRGSQTPAVGVVTNKLSNDADSPTEDGTVNSVCKDVPKDASEPSSGLITCDKTSLLAEDQAADTSTSGERQNDEDNNTKDVHESKQQLPFVDVLAPNTASVPVITSIQFTPDQPIKKQCGGDHYPPATPTKFDPTEMMQSSLSQSISPISSAALPSHFTSGTASGCKRKPKKLNDCIAMLTGKLSERLGVDFFNNETHPETTMQHESSHSSSLSATEPATVNTTGGNSAMQSERSLMDVKSKPHNQAEAQAPMSYSSLPIVSDNRFESSTSLLLAQPKTQLPVSTWSHERCPTGTRSNPQPAPIQLKTAINVRPLSPNVAPQSTFQHSTLSIESADPVSDEPLNLSKNSPLGSTRNAKMMPKRDDHRPHVSTSHTAQQESSMIGHLSAQPALHFMHAHTHNRPSHFHQHSASSSAIVNQHSAHKLTSPISIIPDSNNATITPKSGSGNLSSIKLPPGLIIERVEYKQSRPTFSKEAPSVTIVARHRQVPAQAVLSSNVESSVTESSIDSTASLTNIPFAGNSSHFVKPAPNSATNLRQHSEPNHTMIVGYSNYLDHSIHPNCSEQTSESTSSMRIPSGLRSGPCAENRISVTITESKTPNLERKQEVQIPKMNAALCLSSQSDKMNAPQCSTTQKTPQLNAMHSVAPPKQSISMVSSGPMHKAAPIGVMGHIADLPEKNTPAMTTLIIPQVPMPPMPSQIMPPTTKRTRRKSVFVPLPVSTVETNRDIPVKSVRQQHPTCPSIPAVQSTLSASPGLASANLLASMSLSFVAPNLLPASGAPMLGAIDLQRLASVTLPAHLKPPVIPPLTIPSAAAASAALLEKIFHPTRSEALSTSLELKRDSQYNPDKQPIKEPITMRTNVFRTPVEENCGVTIPPIISDMSTFAAPIEQPSKTTSLSALRTESIKTFDSTVGKVNAPTGMSKGVGRIIKRRASVADYQRKALMEQIWNKSILDKIMEKHTIKVTGVDEAQKDLIVQIPPKDMVVESYNDSKQGDVCLRNMHSVETFSSVPREPQNTPSNISDFSVVHNQDRENSENMTPSTHQNVDQMDQHVELATPHVTGDGKMLKGKESVSIEEPHNTAEDHGKHVQNEQMCPSIQSSTEPVEKVIDADRTHAKERLDVNQCEVPDPSQPLDVTQSNHATTITDEAHTVQKDGSSEIIDSLTATDNQKGGLTKTVRKRRKNELASILSDQLLESFKEVDKSRLNDLKLLHDLTCETPDAKFTLEQIPQLAKRKSNPRLPKLAVQDSPKIATLIAPKKVNNTKKIAKEKESTLEHSLDEDTSKTSVAVSNEVPTNAKNTVCRFKASEKTEKDPSTTGFRRMRKLSIDIERFSSLQKDASKDCAVVQDVSSDQLVTMHKATRLKAQITAESNITVEPKKTVMRIMDAQFNNDITAVSDMQSVEEIQAVDRNRSSGKQASSHLTDPQELEHTPIDTHRCTEFSDNNKIPNTLCFADAQSKAEASNLTTATQKPIASNPPKRIMSRRKSVFVDRDLAQYVAKEEEEQTKNQLFNTTFKDDLILTSRRGTRSQGKLGLDLVESFVEATMKPRDPRRRVLQKRREEERIAKENKEQMQVAPDAEEKITGLVNEIRTVECNSLEQQEFMMNHKETCELPNMHAKTSEEERTPPLVGLQNNIPLRRINTRRSSVCVRALTTPQQAATSSTTNVKDKELIAQPSKEDENLRNIGNEVKRIYRRRASIYQVPDELQEQLENGCEKSRKLRQHVQELDSGGDEGFLAATKKQITSHKTLTRRSKTPGPSDWKRRNQLPLNGTPEPLIESLLLHTSNLEESNAPKRRTTKNSQIAETVSKLFNIQEEIMLIDSSRRKPRKLNPSNIATLLEPPTTEIDKESVETVNVNNMKNGVDNSEPLLSNVFPSVESEGMEKTIATPSLLPRKSFSFSNDEDESPKAINKLVETIINNTGNSSNSSTDYSDDDNMSLACFAARSNALDSGAANQHASVFAKPPLGTAVYSTGRAMSVIADDDSTTNTDALDDDMMSVTTEIPTTLGRSTLNSGRNRRKRRKSRRQCSKLKRQQAKAQEQNNKPTQTFNCELCRKVFKKQDAYNKHRMTLSHIAKLSEQEYLIAQQKLSLNNDDITDAISEQSQLKTKQTFEESSVVPALEEVKKKNNAAEGSTTLESSPSNRTSTPNNHRDEQTVKELSQEEKLFYECCSMLKESNSNENDQLNHLGVSLKTTDTMNQGNSSDRRLVFTDDGNSLSTSISSAFIPSVDGNQMLHVGAACATREESVTDQEQMNYTTVNEVMGEGDNDTFQRCVSPQSSVQSSSTNSSGSASSQSCNNAKIKTKGALKGYDNFKVSIPMTGLTVMSAASTGSIGIGIGKESRLDTLADVALCGDIPKEFGIAGQSDEVNSTDIERITEDQLISLCGEAKLPSIEADSSIVNKVDVPISTSDVIFTTDVRSGVTGTKNSLITSRTGEVKTSKSMAKSKAHRAKYSENVTKSQKKPSSRMITGTNRRRTGKNSLQQVAESVRHDSSLLDESDDVYAFQDSPCDGDLPSMYSSKKNNTFQNQIVVKSDESAHQPLKHKSTVAQTSPLEDHEDSQMSSLSFSDRDDFVYGTNTMSEEEEEEEDKTSSISSEQTSPKKLTSADVQKKSLIMGRIFKKGGAKEKVVGDSKIRSKISATVATAATAAVIDSAKVPSAAAITSKSTAAAKPVAKDFDKLFDTLKNAAEPPVDAMQISNDAEVLPITLTESDRRNTDVTHGPYDSGIENKLHGCPDKNPRAQHQLWQNENEVMTAGAARLRRRRTVHQKNLTESWDSDEFEDFQAGDIMKLIDRAEDDELNDQIHANSNTALAIRLHCEKSGSAKKSGVSECTEPGTAVSQSPPLSDAISREKDKCRTDQLSDKQSALKKEATIFDKKSPKSDVVVTDDTIRKVMESVILETMGKNSNNSGKRKPAAYGSCGVGSASAFNNKALRLISRNNNNVKSCSTAVASAEDVSQALELTSLEEHTLESSVVISSKTITSKFKQKLNSSTRYSADDRRSVEIEITEKEPNSSKLNLLPEISSTTEPPVSASANINSAILNNNNNNTNNNNNSDNRHKPMAKSPRAAGIGSKGRVKPKSTVDDWTGKQLAPLAANKQRRVVPKKMKNVAYDPDSDYEQSIKCKKVKRKLLENDIEANLKIEQLQSTLMNSDDSNILLSTSRRKRNAGEMLYYWSSTSDEEMEREVAGPAKSSANISKVSVNNGAPSGKKRGRKKKQVDNTESSVDRAADKATDDGVGVDGKDLAAGKRSSQEVRALSIDKKSKPTPTMTGKKSTALRKKQQPNQIDSDKSSPTQEPIATGDDSGTTSNEHLQQHGWIMGDSHKKLVTLLAHAKGKHDSRKATINRRK
uniref:C2H2-type domain-containing protein n=1 Tax=Anopheles dirus TaxID=7168 RepID=A0A182ND88_9DIPT